MIEVGDLICYNAAGMKNHSLGLVTKKYVTTANGQVHGMNTYYYILWSKKPKICPRSEYHDPSRRPSIHKQYEHTNWFFDGGWFEKVKPPSQ